MTPEQVHYGLAEKVRLHRAAVHTAAFEKPPNRFKRKKPVPDTPPEKIWINPPPTRARFRYELIYSSRCLIFIDIFRAENTFRNNRLQNNTYNVQFGVLGYRQDIDDSNLIEGKPFVYLRDQSGVTIDGSQRDIGMLVAVDCSQLLIQNATFSGNYQGLLLIDTNDSIVENCHVTNNYEGIYATYSSSSNIIRQCQITDNVFGIRVHGEGQHNRIEDCLVRGNSDSGVFLDTNSRQVEVVRCEFASNETGIYTEGSSDHVVRDSKIHHNTNGVAFGSNTFDGSLTGCTIFNNTEDGIRAYADQRIYNNTIVNNGGHGISAGQHASIANCIIRGNETNLGQSDPSVVYSNVEGGYAGEGNIDQDPLFIDAADNDFRIRPQSPGIDAGMLHDVAVLSLDGNGDGWVHPDMGAHESQGKPDIFGFSLGNRFIYTTHAGGATYDSERLVSTYDRSSYDVPTYVISLSRDGSELQREWYERQDGQVVLRSVDEPAKFDQMEFTDGLVRYWYPMRAGDVRSSSSGVSGRGDFYGYLHAELDAIVQKKENLTLDGKSFAAFKVKYTLRIWGDTVDEQRSTFYEWVSPYLGVVKYSDDHYSDTLKSFLIGGGYIDGSGSILAFYDILDDPSTDADKDGIPDMEEKGPFLNDPSFDGNGDTVPDFEQSNVFSTYSAGGDHYATLAVPAPLTIEAAEVLNTPEPATVPEGIAFPYGFFRIVINGLSDDGLVELSLFLEEGMQPITYYKFGPTPDDTGDHWYEFLYDGETGAELDDYKVRLHFLDAHRGDDLLEKDGMIFDIGAPGFAPNDTGNDDTDSDTDTGTDTDTDTHTSGGGGGGCFLGSLAIAQ
jgi:parallel beta-helix repeat protein